MFELDPRLAADTVELARWKLCRVLLMNDANYPWLLLVPRRPDASEIADLDSVERAQLMVEIAETAQSLKAITTCDKINVASLGNVVAQLHVHVIARFRGDVAWPKPVWGAAPPRPYDREELHNLVTPLRKKIWLS